MCAPWNGPYIDETLGQLSEDSTEDLCDWIVSQGRAYWSLIVAKKDEERETALREAFELEYRLSRGHSHPQLLKWSYEVTNPDYCGYQSPAALPMAIYERRFDGDLLSREEEIFKRVDKLLAGEA